MKPNTSEDTKMKCAGRRTFSHPVVGVRITLDISVILPVLLSLAAAQEVSDCTWKPQSEVEDGVTAVECDLKTLQTGPTAIPQVRSTVSQSLVFELRLDVKKVFLFNLTIYKCCNLL